MGTGVQRDNALTSLSPPNTNLCLISHWTNSAEGWRQGAQRGSQLPGARAELGKLENGSGVAHRK